MFEQSSLTVDEPDDAVEVCVVVSGITGTVETPFEVNVTLTNNTASKTIHGQKLFVQQ